MGRWTDGSDQLGRTVAAVLNDFLVQNYADFDVGQQWKNALLALKLIESVTVHVCFVQKAAR